MRVASDEKTVKKNEDPPFFVTRLSCDDKTSILRQDFHPMTKAMVLLARKTLKIIDKQQCFVRRHDARISSVNGCLAMQPPAPKATEQN